MASFRRRRRRRAQRSNVSVLFAMFVYSLIGLGARSLIDWLSYRRDLAQHRIERDDMLLRQSYADERQVRQHEAPLSPQQPPGPGYR